MNQKKNRILRKAWRLSGFSEEDKLKDNTNTINCIRIDMLLVYNSLTKNKFIWKLSEIEIAKLIVNTCGMFLEVKIMQMNDSSILRHRAYFDSLVERIPKEDLIYFKDCSPVLRMVNEIQIRNEYNK